MRGVRDELETMPMNNQSFSSVCFTVVIAVVASGGCGDDEQLGFPQSQGGSGGATGGGGAGTGGEATGGNGGGGGSGGSIPTNVNCDAPAGMAGTLTTEEVMGGLDSPLSVSNAPGDDRLYVVEQPGTIKVYNDGDVTDFLDIRNRTETFLMGDERGLLGLAFHPDYAKNGRFFVHYSNGPSGPGASTGDTVIEEYRRSANNPLVADPDPVQLVITTPQPAGNHNGGTIAFSPVDGFLWIGLGDGGGGGDTFNTGQNKNSPLATLLRLDVDSAQPYAIPQGNITDGIPEIYDWGLRNPYRWSFDPCTGDRYIGDVGQGCYEEISVAAFDAGNINWGWSAMEGNHCFVDLGGCDDVPPMDCMQVGEPAAAEHPRSEAQSITGGQVYRGSAIPWLRGAYVYGDFATGRLWYLRWSGGVVTEGPTPLPGLETFQNPSGFGLDNDGELYVASYTGGRVFRVISR